MCDWCKNIGEKRNPIESVYGSTWYIELSGENKQAYFFHRIFDRCGADGIKSNYCPNCGRKLVICDLEEDNKSNNMISHPKHYTYSKFEPKDVIREWGLNFNLGSAVKYISRAGRKGDKIEDLQKAVQFLKFEIEALEEERNKLE